MSRALALVPCALAVAAAFAACTQSPTHGSPQTNVAAQPPAVGGFEVALTPRGDVPGVPNFAKVSDVLYRGAQPTREGFLELKKMGVRTVVNLRQAHSDVDLLSGTGLRYVNIPESAWHPEDEDVSAFLKVVRDPANAPVFVHCQHGADRTGYTVATYRVVEQHWSNDAALTELRNFGLHEVWVDIPPYVMALDVARIEKAVAKTGAIEITAP